MNHLSNKSPPQPSARSTLRALTVIVNKMSANMDLLNALAAQLGREKVVAMCEAFLSKPAAAAAKQVKKISKKADADASSAGGEAKAKRQLPLKLVQWQAFVRFCKEKFPERFEGVKGAPAMQTLCKSIREEEGVWEEFESGWVAPAPALEPAPAFAPLPRRPSPGPLPADAVEEDADTEDEAAPAAKPKRQWSEEAKASAAAKRAAKKAAKKAAGGTGSSSDGESVASKGSKKEKDE